MKMRKDTGMFNLLEPMLEKPFEVVALNEEITLNSPHENPNPHADLPQPQ